ncbi:hypothetical protein B2J73_14610 [Stutzerimonas stutzeri]|uniref:heparinase II/III domain-containing protein n=1 Tax=Stutzerimonas stutzeri TaxID=316 RepID=UPI0009A40001|nr:heparinase II/III family protein [Stutzerimonas stutzeri]OPG82724.1 hypothetical protein B2J73_14610 [Stutzerimonas stutzeri]
MFSILGDLLGDLNKGYNSFIGETGSDAAKRKLQCAQSGVVLLNGFGDFESAVDLLKFDWKQNGQDRNWWWQLQALPFLNWYIGAYDLLTEAERKQADDFCGRALEQWIKFALEDKTSPLVWHDHASAFRLRNLVRWIVFKSINGGLGAIFSADYQRQIGELIDRHIVFLLEEVNYSRHTNHGFDQMLVVYTVTLLFPNNAKFRCAKKISFDRLVDELDFAFTYQGVHKENSPGYQKFMISRLRMLQELKTLGEREISGRVDKLIESAEHFLAAITLPNGFLPLIGDTKGEDVGVVKEFQRGVEVFDYSDSGYVIVRGVDKAGVKFHLIFKSTHLSDYHRHDDDLSIHFSYGDEVILGDGGLLYYNEKDDKRKFVRSCEAHSTVFIHGKKAIRRRKELNSPPTLRLVDSFIAVGESFAFNDRLRRTIDFSEILDGKIKIIDEVFGGCAGKKKIASNFFFPYACGGSKFSTFVEAESKNSIIRFVCNRGLQDHEFHYCGAFFSDRYGEVKDASRILFLSELGRQEIDMFFKRKGRLAKIDADGNDHLSCDVKNFDLPVSASESISLSGRVGETGFVESLKIDPDDLVKRIKWQASENAETGESGKVVKGILAWFADAKNKYDLFIRTARGLPVAITVAGYSFRPHYSITTEQGRVFTWFISNSDGFWLVLHQGVLGIYFPSSALYFSFAAHSGREHQSGIISLYDMLIKALDCLALKDLDSVSYEEARPLGVLLSYSRPFHYFVDSLQSAFSALTDSNSVSLPLRVLGFRRGMYFPVERLFPNAMIDVYENATLLNSKMLVEGGYTLKPMKENARSGNEGPFQSAVVRASLSRDVHQPYFLRYSSIIDGSYPVVWIGVCKEKRAWANNLEVIEHLVRQLSAKFPNLAIIFDGMTSPVDYDLDEFCSEEAVDDVALVNSLAHAFSQVKVINAVGLKSHEKIFLASKSDLFVTNFLTDSMYVARFACRPGVAYGASSATAKEHSHPYTIFLPSSFVKDEVHERSKNWATVGYTIDKFKLSDLVISLFDKSRTALSESMPISGRGFSKSYNPFNHSFNIRSRSSKPVYLSLGESEFHGFSVRTAHAHPIGICRRYSFRFEAFAEGCPQVYIIGYKDNERFFTERVNCGRTKLVSFPENVDSFRVFLRLSESDVVEFFDVHWVTSFAVGSIRYNGLIE